MTHVSFNSYASKIFENHPLVVWGLDDNLHYLSVFGQDQVGYDRREFSNWIQTDCYVGQPLSGFPDGLSHEFSVTGKLIPDFEKTSCEIELVGISRWSDYIQTSTSTWNKVAYTNEQTLATASWYEKFTSGPSVEILKDAYRKSMCVSFFIALNSDVEDKLDYINIKIAYQNKNTNLPENQVKKIIIPETEDEWKKILATFNMENVGEGFILTVQFIFNSSTTSNEIIWLAGLNVGYWSETFCHEFNGVVPIETPESLKSIINVDYCAPIAAAFDNSKNGWAIIDQARLLAVHDGLPLVFGSINQTCLYYSLTENKPSIVLPSNGFLTQNGSYSDSTFEFWMRINNKSQTETKIFGPLTSQDGLYVERGFLTLKVGSKYASHYVGKWYRPMLIAIRYSESKVSLLINGEQVMSMTITQSDIDSLSSDEYLGFYCTEDTFPFEIDCIAIYPYYQSTEIAKKNFVYGQSVHKTNIVDHSHNGETIYFDFPFSKYSVDFKYPDISRWNTGYFTNVFVNDKVLSVPSFNTPSVIIKSFNENDTNLESQWESTLTSSISASSTYIHFKNLGENKYGYLYYDTINQLNEIVKTIYIDVTMQGNGPIFALKDKVSNSYLIVRVQDSNIEIKFSNSGSAEQLLYSHAITLEQRKKIGLNISAFMSFYSRHIGSFLFSPQSVSMYVGGFNGVSFNGLIHSVDFNGAEYSTQLQNLQNGFMILNPDDWISNNQLCFFIENNKLKMDINISGYWRSSIPLSFFAKYVNNENGKKHYEIDMMQLNIEAAIPPSSSYNDADIKPYITFQKDGTGAKSIFDYTETGYIDNILDFINENWEEKKYYFVDNSIIFPPKQDILEKVLMSFYIKFDVKKTKQKSIMLKRLEVASIAFDADKYFNIGTRYGQDVRVFAKSGDAIVYKTKNPFLITKDSTSNLYLTNDSGIQMPNISSTYERGIYIPINSGRAPDYDIGAIRLWFKYNDKYFPSSPRKIFEFNSKNKTYYGYLSRDYDYERAKLILIDSKTGQEAKNIRYIQEDIEVFSLLVTSQRWTSISIMFGESLPFDGFEGSLILMPGACYQNIATYESSNEAIYSVITSNKWRDFNETYNWGPGASGTLPNKLSTKYGSWTEVLDQKLVETFFVNTKPIYRSLIGTESIKINDDKNSPEIFESEVKFYSDVVVKNFVLKSGEPYNVR